MRELLFFQSWFTEHTEDIHSNW